MDPEEMAEMKELFIKTFDSDIAALSKMVAGIFDRMAKSGTSIHHAHTYVMNLSSSLLAKIMAIYIAQAKDGEIDSAYESVHVEIQVLLRKVLERHFPDRASFAIEAGLNGAENFPMTKRMCPKCKSVHLDGYVHALGSSGGDETPRTVGNRIATTTCVSCGEYLIFDEGGTLQLMPEDIWRKIPVDTQDEMMKLRSAILLLKKYGLETSHPSVIK